MPSDLETLIAELPAGWLLEVYVTESGPLWEAISPENSYGEGDTAAEAITEAGGLDDD